MPMWIDLIVEPFQYKFMVRALIVCLAVGVMCPFLGAHVINREMGFMGDALAHTVMPGLVAASAVGLTPMFGAIPLVLSSGAGAESRYSMSAVVFGGITLSALITLYLIPALYKFIEAKREI